MKSLTVSKACALFTLFLMISLVLGACGDNNNVLTLNTPPAATTSSAGATPTAAPNTVASTAIAATPVGRATVTIIPSGTTSAALTPATGTTAAATTSGTSSSQVPRFEAADPCPFKLSKGQTVGPNLQCGYVIVPEVHSDPNNGRTIKLGVVVLKSKNKNTTQAPIIYLQGGPGGNNNSTLQVFADTTYPIANIVQNQDVVIFDQRGVGTSQPSLFCSEIDTLAHQDLDKVVSQQEANQKSTEALFQCRDRLTSQGVNLKAYTSAENASDVEDIRQAFGYNKVTLYGTSYGTRLALTVMRDHPQNIQSVIIDSTYTPQANLEVEEPANAQRAFDELFNACASDNSCNSDYPNLKATFSQTFAQLNKTPAMLKVKDSDTGQSYTVAVDGNLFVSVLFSMLYSTEVITILPALITTIQQGRYEILQAILPDILFEERDISEAMYYSVECSEEVPFENVADITKDAQGVMPEITESFIPGAQATFTTCAQWPINKPNPIENQPVKSDIPTLVLSGRFDPITPPLEGQDAAKTLSKSFYVLFPNSGHVPSIVSTPYGNCAANVVQAFLKDPTAKPDSSCTAKLTVQFLPKSSIDLLINNIQQSNP